MSRGAYKKLAGFVVMVLTMTLGGCMHSVDQETERQVGYVPQEKYSGVLNVTKSADPNKQDSYYLTTEAGEKITLQSLSFNLGSKEYLGRQVEISATPAESKNGKKVLEVVSIDVADSDFMDITNEDETAVTWETYSNREQGWRIDYKSDWRIEKEGKLVEFEAPRPRGERETELGEADSDLIKIIEMEKGFPKDLSDYLAMDNPDSMRLNGMGYIQSRVGKQNIFSYKHVSADDLITDYYFSHDSNIYKISYETRDGDGKNEHKNLFFEMLLSFELLDYVAGGGKEDVSASDGSKSGEEKVPSDETGAEEEETAGDESISADEELGEEPLMDGYRRFESLPYKFQAQYPKSWYYSGKRSGESGIQHQYLFIDEPIEEDISEGLVSLDLLSSPLPSGSTMTLPNGKKAVTVTKDGQLQLYVERGANHTYRFSGATRYEGVMKAMASSISD